MSNEVLLIGVFDLFHQGHINLFRNASLLGNVTVGIVKDEAVKKQKGDNRPVFKQDQRHAIVESCRYVKSAYLIDDFDILKLYEELTKDGYWRYNIAVRGEDQDHIKGFDELKSLGVLVVTFPRTEGVSTSKLVDNIK